MLRACLRFRRALFLLLHKLRIAPCFALSQSYRYSDFALSRFILIPVAFEIASSLFRALCVCRACLRFRRALFLLLHKLRIAPCFALSQSYRYSDFALSRFILIPVAFEIASSLFRALRVRRACLRFRRAYAIKKDDTRMDTALTDYIKHQCSHFPTLALSKSGSRVVSHLIPLSLLAPHVFLFYCIVPAQFILNEKSPGFSTGPS